MKDKKILISINNLTKKYGDFVVLDNISFNIYEGDKIALIGSNGAGKSTLVEIIARIRSKTSGKITYNLKDPKREIGLQLQDTTFPEGLKLSDIIKFYCDVFKIPKDDGYINEMLTFFKIKEFTNRWLGKLSGGQRQRVNAFLTIITKPRILIVDEMATGLDITTKIQLIEFINNYVEKNKITYITISHSEQEIIKTSNRILVIENGKISDDVLTKDINEKWVYNYFLSNK